MPNKKVLIHSIVFSPDGVSTAYLYNDIALGFKNAGNEVVVLTTTPHYNYDESNVSNQQFKKKMLGLYYISYFEGIKVYHVTIRKYKSTIARLFSFIYWHIMSFLLALNIKKIDFILTPSPPLTIGLLSVIISKIKGAKCIYNVQEIYPDFLIKHGNLKSKLIINILLWIEKYIYDNCEFVTTIDKQFYENIIHKFKYKNKLKVIPNFVDTELYCPVDVDDNFLKQNFFNKDSLKAMYAGNIGYAQDWEPIIEAAKHYNRTNKVQFIIIGEGVKKEYLENAIIKYKLDNIILLPYIERIKIPMYNSAADVHFICMNEAIEEEGFPSKIYTIMACSKPTIVCSGVNTSLYNFLKDKNCSILITNNRVQNFITTIENILTNKEILHELGKNGRENILNSYSKNIVVDKYVELIS